MNRTDQATRRATTAIVVAVALFAAGDSFTHIYDLARTHGQGMVSAALLPLAGDGLVAAASSAMLAAARNGKTVPARARVLLLAGIAATIAANVACGLPAGVTGALLSVRGRWPRTWAVSRSCRGCGKTWVHPRRRVHPPGTHPRRRPRRPRVHRQMQMQSRTS